MSDLLSVLEKKYKSFDKRLEVLESASNDIDADTAEKAVQLLAEKAKYGQHFSDVVSVAAKFNINNKESFLLEFAEKAKDDPNQSGSSFYILYKLGYKDAADQYWKRCIDHYSHPSLKARMIAFGLLFDDLSEEAEKMINELVSNNNDIPDLCLKKPEPKNICNLSTWID